MKIVRDKISGAWILIPVTAEEIQIFEVISKRLKIGSVLFYDGKTPDVEVGVYSLNFNIGGTQKQVSIFDRHTTVMPIGGINFSMCSDTDENEVRDIRDTCYLRSGGKLIFLGAPISNLKGMMVTAKICSNCEGGMIDKEELKRGCHASCQESLAA